MKKESITKLFILLFFTIAFSCGGQSPKIEDKEIASSLTADNDTTNHLLVFKEDVYDFGNIDGKKKEFISTDFVFVNNNKKPLIIKKVDVSCGCTSAKYPTKPVM